MFGDFPTTRASSRELVQKPVTRFPIAELGDVFALEQREKLKQGQGHA